MRTLKKLKTRTSKLQFLQMRYDALKMMYYDDLKITPIEKRGVEVKIPVKSGRKVKPLDMLFGIAVAREYAEKKLAGVKRGVILTKMTELANKGKLKYWGKRRIVQSSNNETGPNLLWHIIKKCRSYI